MRIAVLCSGVYVGGMEVVALTVARGLRDRGHDVRVLANAWSDGDFPQRLAEAELPAKRVYVGKVSMTLRRPYLGWTAAALARLPHAMLSARRWLRDFDPHVVIAHNRDWVLLLGPVLGGRPLIFHMHEAPPATPRMRGLFRRVAARTTTFVAVSEHVRSRLVELGIPATRTHVVQNGVQVPPRVLGTRGTPRTAFTVGIVGRVAEWKGHGDLLAALALLRDGGLAVRCVVAGDGDPEYVRALRDTAESLGLSAAMDWRGFVSDTSAVYGELDACVVPSRVDEAFGLVAVEAGLASVPVVAARGGGLAEVVEDGTTGYLVDSGSPQQLAARLASLAADPPLRARMGKAARERMLDRFTADRMVRDIEAACQDAVRP